MLNEDVNTHKYLSFVHFCFFRCWKFTFNLSFCQILSYLPIFFNKYCWYHLSTCSTHYQKVSDSFETQSETETCHEQILFQFTKSKNFYHSYLQKLTLHYKPRHQCLKYVKNGAKTWQSCYYSLLLITTKITCKNLRMTCYTEGETISILHQASSSISLSHPLTQLLSHFTLA